MNRYKTTLHTIIFLIVFFLKSANALDTNGNLGRDNNSNSESVGDFNHDGQQDLAVRDTLRNTVTVYLGNGNGGFLKAGKLANATNPPNTQMADLNADGKLDLIKTHPGIGGLSIALGLGQDKYKSRVHYLQGIRPLTVTVGDFNGDSTSDLAAIDLEQNRGFLLYGDSNANFKLQETDPSNLVLLPSLPEEPSQDIPGDPTATGANKILLPKQSSTRTKGFITKAAAPTTAALEQSVLQKINAYRVARKLPALSINATISNEARIHSQNMASGKVQFGHQGFSTRVQTLKKSFALKAVAENVAMNQGFSDPAATAVNGWINSTGHRNNIVGNYNLTGIGVAKSSSGAYYLTQIFLKR